MKKTIIIPTQQTTIPLAHKKSRSKNKKKKKIGGNATPITFARRSP